MLLAIIGKEGLIGHEISDSYNRGSFTVVLIYFNLGREQVSQRHHPLKPTLGTTHLPYLRQLPHPQQGQPQVPVIHPPPDHPLPPTILPNAQPHRVLVRIAQTHHKVKNLQDPSSHEI